MWSAISVSGVAARQLIVNVELAVMSAPGASLVAQLSPVRVEILADGGPAAPGRIFGSRSRTSVVLTR
ncbi:hypothetical protein K1W54_22225 [Micromonospora sp. CPCC 205371]|nr:hypothetical protein [Micromonospora sp. CPCC 205371]